MDDLADQLLSFLCRLCWDSYNNIYDGAIGGNNCHQPSVNYCHKGHHARLDSSLAVRTNNKMKTLTDHCP